MNTRQYAIYNVVIGIFILIALALMNVGHNQLRDELARERLRNSNLLHALQYEELAHGDEILLLKRENSTLTEWVESCR